MPHPAQDGPPFDTITDYAGLPPKSSSRSTTPNRWHRFLDGKTAAQRLLLTLGASAGALLTIGAATTAVIRFVDRRPEHGTTPVERAQRVENQTTGADDLVRYLLARVDGPPVQLDHQVIAPRGAADVSLQYDCAKPTGCNLVRIGTPDSIPAEVTGGFWLQGCYRVTKKGPGYEAQPLDISLHWRGDTCAP